MKRLKTITIAAVMLLFIAGTVKIESNIQDKAKQTEQAGFWEWLTGSGNPPPGKIKVPTHG